jgi:putative inorganic carbon (hco3(-)) transporter
MMERLAFNCGLGSRSAIDDPLSTSDERRARANARRLSTVARRSSTVTPERDGLAFGALLAFMAVLLVRPQDQIPFLSALHLANLTGAVAFVALVAGRLSRGLPPSRMTPEVWGVLGFAAIMLATVPLSFWPGGSLAVFTDVYVKVVLIFIVIVNTLTSRARVQQYITVVVSGATYVGVRAVLDYLRGVNLIEGNRVAGSVGGLFANPNDMALNMVTFLPLAVAVALYRGKISLRLLGLLGAGSIALTIIFSQSRGGTVGLMAMLAVLLYQMRRLRPGVAALMVATSLFALPLLPSSFTERMASIFDADQDPTGSREARKTLLREGWQVFLAHPIAGVGPGQFQNFNTEGRVEPWRQTHNAPLQVAAEMGIVGLAVFLFLVWTAVMAGVHAKRAIRAARGGPRARAPGHGRVSGPAGRVSRAAGRVFRPGKSGSGGASDDLDWLELHAGIIIAASIGWFVAANFASVAYYWTFYLMLGLAGAIRDVSLQVAREHQAEVRSSTRSATWKKVA